MNGEIRKDIAMVVVVGVLALGIPLACAATQADISLRSQLRDLEAKVDRLFDRVEELNRNLCTCRSE